MLPYAGTAGRRVGQQAGGACIRRGSNCEATAGPGAAEPCTQGRDRQLPGSIPWLESFQADGAGGGGQRRRCPRRELRGWQRGERLVLQALWRRGACGAAAQRWRGSSGGGGRAAAQHGTARHSAARRAAAWLSPGCKRPRVIWELTKQAAVVRAGGQPAHKLRPVARRRHHALDPTPPQAPRRVVLPACLAAPAWAEHPSGMDPTLRRAALTPKSRVQLLIVHGIDERVELVHDESADQLCGAACAKDSWGGGWVGEGPRLE